MGAVAFLSWEQLSAVGVLASAVVTAVLAFFTRRLAAEAGDETRANWRPVLVIDEALKLGGRKVAVQGEALAIAVRNVGRGPALQISAYIALDDDSPDPVVVRPKDLADVAAPDEVLLMLWPDFLTHARPRFAPLALPGWTSFAGRVTYGDIAYVRHVTAFQVGIRADGETTLLSQRFLGVERPTGVDRMRWRTRVAWWKVKFGTRRILSDRRRRRNTP